MKRAWQRSVGLQCVRGRGGSGPAAASAESLPAQRMAQAGLLWCPGMASAEADAIYSQNEAHARVTLCKNLDSEFRNGGQTE